MGHISVLLKLVRENDLMIPFNYTFQEKSTNINKTRSTDWMKDPNKRIPDSWRELFPGWGFAHEQKEGYRVGTRLPILEAFDIEEHVEEGFLFPSDSELQFDWIKDELDEHGIEALAWYRPFHIDPQSEWGITITDRGIWYLAKNVMSQKYEAPLTLEEIHDCFDLAYQFLYYHELFHFQVEYAATILELNTPRRSTRVYAGFWEHGFYSPGPNNCSPLEEAMANEFARWKVCHGQPKRLKDAIVNFMQTQQPSGYRDFKDVKHNQKWELGLNSLLESMKIKSTPFAKSIFEQYNTYINLEEAVPCRIVTTGLPPQYSVRLMNLMNFCRTNSFEKSISKIKKKNINAYKDLELSFKEIEQNGLASFRTTRRVWKEWDLKKNRKLGEYRFDGTNYRVYLTKHSGEWIFRSVSPKSQQDADQKAFKKDRFNPNVAIHKYDCHFSI
jgi:hypothetical protein